MRGKWEKRERRRKRTRKVEWSRGKGLLGGKRSWESPSLAEVSFLPEM